MKTLITVALGVYLILPPIAWAQAVCGERAKFIETLARQYQEAPTAIGMTSNGQIIEVLTSAKGTWSIIITSPKGKTCLVASGDAWEIMERVMGTPVAPKVDR